MGSRVDQLRERFERADKRKAWSCGMCPSCFQREACPGGSDGTSCPNYLAPEPTRHMWPRIYRQALQDVKEAVLAVDKVRRIGRATALREAMQHIHGIPPEEIKEIEDDMHITAGSWDVLP